MTAAAPRIQVRGVGMSFGANQVLRGVDLDLAPGEVVALLGANGAGKSTLIKILAGAHTGYTGDVLVEGEPVQLRSPAGARRIGIATVHQRVREGIVPGLSVAENLAFDFLAGAKLPWLVPRREIQAIARRAVEVLGLGWSDAVLRRDVATLGISDAQLLVVARALLDRPRLLILDEPTSALSATEAGRLFSVIDRLRTDGLAVLLVSHRLGEVDTIADRAVVLRDGRVTADVRRPLSWSVLLPAMLGERAVESQAADTDADRPAGPAGPKDLPVAARLRGVRLKPEAPPLDLDLNSGEVTGVLGLIGAGKSELAHGLFGSARWPSGTAEIVGLDRAPRSPAEAVAAGVFLVPEDRAGQALLPGWSIARTLSLPFLTAVSGRLGVLAARPERERASTVIERLGIVARGTRTEVDELSGGNQQKVVVGRWLLKDQKILLLDEPTRGVDVGARAELYQVIRALAEDGVGVLLVSSEVPEVLGLADRVLVMREGRIVHRAPATELDEDTVLDLVMAGSLLQSEGEPA
jgi:simple sugar transport system ATP-binding protein